MSPDLWGRRVGHPLPVTTLSPVQWVQTSPWRLAVQMDIGWPLSTETAHCPMPQTLRSAGTFTRGHCLPRSCSLRAEWGKKGQCVLEPREKLGAQGCICPGCGRPLPPLCSHKPWTGHGSPFLGCPALVGASVPFTGLQESQALQPSWPPLGPMATAVSF